MAPFRLLPWVVFICQDMVQVDMDLNLLIRKRIIWDSSSWLFMQKVNGIQIIQKRFSKLSRNYFQTLWELTVKHDKRQSSG